MPSIVTMALEMLHHLPDKARYWSKIVIFFHTPLAFGAVLGGSLLEYRYPVWYGKTRMVGLPDGRVKKPVF